jgi:hypothetical protein
VRAVPAIAALLLAATPLAAQERPPQPQTHVVQPGETLWEIASRYLDDPFLWPELFRINVDQIRDPALIYPRQRLLIPGQQRLAEAPVYVPEAPGDDRPRLQLGEVGLRPAVAEGDFYRASFVARDADVVRVGTLADRADLTVVPANMRPQIQLHHRVYVRLTAPDAVSIGERLHFLRPERQVRPHGRIFRPTAVGTVADVDGRTATVVIVGMFDRADIGDVAVPMARFPIEGLEQPVEAGDLQARIFAFQDERPLQMRESILYLDVGSRAGVSVGDEFEAYMPPQSMEWGERPEIRIARMQVVRVTDATASVRVTAMEQPAIEQGLPVRRVARMP